MTLLLPAGKDGVVAVRALSRSERGGEDGTKGDVGVDAALMKKCQRCCPIDNACCSCCCQAEENGV